MVRSGLAALALLAAAALPVAAQRDISQRWYTFLERNLTIEVVSENTGTLRILRGQPGLLEVTGQSQQGFAGFALGGRQEDELRLTAVGGQSADYLVVVPEDVRIRVRLPDRKHVEVPSARPGATYSWGRDGAPDTPDRSPAPARENALSGPTAETMFLSHFSRAVPRSFSVADLGNFDRLDVRFGGNDFRLSTSRAVSVDPGRNDTIELRAVQPGLSAVISLPVDTRDFRLVLGGKLALEVVSGEIRSYCDQIEMQASGIGTRTYSYVPGGELVCR
jgi:hypothetical protein